MSIAVRLSGAGIEAGREDDDVEWDLALGRADPVRSDALDRRRAEVDEVDVRSVVDVEVPVFERDTPCAESMISGTSFAATFGSRIRARIFSRTNSETSSFTAGSKKISLKPAIQILSDPSAQSRSRIARRSSGERLKYARVSPASSKPTKWRHTACRISG